MQEQGVALPSACQHNFPDGCHVDRSTPSCRSGQLPSVVAITSSNASTDVPGAMNISYPCRPRRRPGRVALHASACTLCGSKADSLSRSTGDEIHLDKVL